MDFVKDEIMKLNIVNKYGIILKSKDRLETIISFDKFLLLTKKFMDEIIKYILVNNNCDEFGSCQISSALGDKSNSFVAYENKIVISKRIVQKLYQGDILELIALFEGTAHLKLKYEIMNLEVNERVIRSIKEMLLRNMKACQGGNVINNLFDNSFSIYYRDNQKLFSEDKIATIEAIKLFIEFCEFFNINLSHKELKSVNNKLKLVEKQYNNYLRDIRYNFNITDSYMDFEKLFDILIKKNPEWLMIEQLNIEYYCDKWGYVHKRTKEELELLLEKELDINKRLYIKRLIGGNEKKVLSKKELDTPNYLYHCKNLETSSKRKTKKER